MLDLHGGERLRAPGSARPLQSFVAVLHCAVYFFPPPRLCPWASQPASRDMYSSLSSPRLASPRHSRAAISLCRSQEGEGVSTPLHRSPCTPPPESVFLSCAPTSNRSGVTPSARTQQISAKKQLPRLLPKKQSGRRRCCELVPISTSRQPTHVTFHFVRFCFCFPYSQQV